MEEKTLLAFAKWMQSKDEKLAKVPVEQVAAKVAEALKTQEGQKQLAPLLQQFKSEVREIMRSGGKMECAIKNIEQGAKLQNGGMISERRMSKLFDKAGMPALNSDSANYFLENSMSRRNFRHRMKAARNRGIEGRDNRISFALTGNEPVSDTDNGMVWKTDPDGNKSLTGLGQRWLNKGYISTMSNTDNIDRNVFRERMSDLRNRGVRGRSNRIKLALSPTAWNNQPSSTARFSWMTRSDYDNFPMPKPILTDENIKPEWVEPELSGVSSESKFTNANVYDKAIKKADWHAPQKPVMASQHDVMADHAKKGTLGYYLSTALSEFKRNK